MSTDYDYFGLDTMNYICLDHRGRSGYAKWKLMDFSGPEINLGYIGYKEKKYVYLPVDLLSILYERFKKANPSGSIISINDDYLDLLDARFGEEECTRRFDNREIGYGIDDEGDDEGYPHLRPYLPELFEPSTIERLASDPWLDCVLLRQAQQIGAERGGIAPNLWVNRSARWSPEWREYCDRLATEQEIQADIQSTPWWKRMFKA